MPDLYQKLTDHMERNNVFIHGQISYRPGIFQRFRVENSSKSSKNIFVVVHDDEQGASYGDWRIPELWQTCWLNSHSKISSLEREERQRKIAEQKEKLRELQRQASKRAGVLLNHPQVKEASITHPYVRKKRIIPYYARQLRSTLVLPMKNIEGEVQSLQFIRKSLFKQFKKGAPVKGAFLHLGEKVRETDIIRVCEGYATGCSIYEAVGEHVVVAFSARNVVEVSMAFRLKFPLNHIQVCMDNDVVGLELGLKASQMVSGSAVAPDFSQFKGSEDFSDFNDLFCIAGIEEVERQLLIS